MHKSQLRAAKFRDGHRHYYRMAERIGHVHRLRRRMLALTVTEAYTLSFYVFMASDGEDLFVCAENETDCVLRKHFTTRRYA